MDFKNPKHQAIVVGIDDYDDFERSNIASLQGCVNDAKMFREWLVDENGGGLDPANVAMIVSTIPRPAPPPMPNRPIKDDIEEEILKLIRRQLQTGGQIGDRLYLWFSGHGVTPSRDENECAILMANAQLITLGGHSFPGRVAARDLCFRAIFREVVLFMDCCRTVSGLESANLGYNIAGIPSGANGVRYLQAFATSSTAASSERILPHPLDPAKPASMHGVFTHALLEGLKKGTNLNGRIDSASLAGYVKERAQELLPADDNQRPDFRFHDDEIIDFGQGQRTQVQVSLTNPAAGFQVRFGGNNFDLVHRTSSSAAAAATLQLAPARYLFAVPGDGDAFQNATLVEVLGGPIRVNL